MARTATHQFPATLGAVGVPKSAPLVLAVAALIFAPSAGAHGGPVTEALETGDVFASAGVPRAAIEQAAADARRTGYPIKVAVVTKPADLGEAQTLWRRPRETARFVGLALPSAAAGTVVVLMPNGFGVYRAGKDVSAEESALRRITVAPDGPGLARAAVDAVGILATAGESGGSGGFDWLDRALIGTGAVILLGVLVVLGATLRRRRAAELHS